MNWSLLAMLIVILIGVAASNVWLRRRAEAEREEEASRSARSDRSRDDDPIA